MTKYKQATIIFTLIIGAVLALPQFVVAKNNPLTANYYLDVVLDTTDFVNQMSRYDVWIASPSQVLVHQSTVAKIRKKNPDIIILGYVPSQSYDTRYNSTDAIFKYMRVQDSWWLRDSSGDYVFNWPGVQHIDMNREWSRYLVDFVNQKIASLNEIDGIFFDVVSSNIIAVNDGDLDFDKNGERDSAAEANSLWLARTQYFLEYANDNLHTDYIVINGDSHSSFQKNVSGRMFETFPTPWEGDGSWSTVMNNLKKNKERNSQPQLMIINSNTNNSGKERYSQVRYGVASSLLEDDVYFSYDFGDQDHGQLWWYDEYGVGLGTAIGKATSQSGYSSYRPDVWQRDFERGRSVINTTNVRQKVELGGEYEKIHGTEDKSVNDGAIVSEVEVSGTDGILLLKTFESLDDVIFENGAFVRFFHPDGTRVRNGFFTFEEGQAGGVQIAKIEIDAKGEKELLVVSGSKLTLFRGDGQLYMKKYPYGASYQGELRVAVEDIDKDGLKEIFVAPSDGYPAPIKVYSHHGKQIKNDWYPFGSGYTGGYNLDIGYFGDTDRNNLIIGTGFDDYPIVHIFDYRYQLLRSWWPFDYRFRGGVDVAAGDVDGDGIDEVVVGPGPGMDPVIRIFDSFGKVLYPEFAAYSSFVRPGIDVLVVDVDFDGQDDIVGMSRGL